MTHSETHCEMHYEKFVVLFRNIGKSYTKELIAAETVFPHVVRLPCLVPDNALVVGRYSVLPFYKEVEDTIHLKGSRLINTYQQHLFVADMKNWYNTLHDFTPRTWFSFDAIPSDYHGPFVLKGATNSKKFNWNTHMFAKDRQAAVQVMCNLHDDTYVGEQGICIREYVPLYTYCEASHGLPISKEFRFFVLQNEIIAGSFYWAPWAEELHTPSPDMVPKDFLQRIVKTIGESCTFYTMDVAQTEKGDWLLIELNDGQQAGPACTPEYELYLAILNKLQHSSF